ncbi:MAG: 4Fe-4S dicluster domain-containing protein [Persicimonas sp.]
MSDKPKNSDLPRHAQPQPGAEIAMRTREDGGVTVSFSDGSDDLDVSRREFMRITGVAAASAAMAGAACRNPKETIVPYVDRPEEVRIGQGNYYATVCSGCSTQCGILVETRAGRPIKIEGNPDHPVSRGATCARGQASYLRLYDPDRQQKPLKVSKDDRHAELDWQTLDQEVINALGKAGRSGGVRILTSAMTGSAQQALIDEITGALPNARHYTYDPLTSQAATQANELAYGQPHLPHYRFDKASMVVSLGSDFLGTWLSPVEFTKQFTSRRSLREYEWGDKQGQPAEMSRLVAFEGHLSLTGSNADDRYRVRYSDLPYVALALANQVAANSPRATSAIRSALNSFTAEAVAERVGVPASVLETVAEELSQNRGESLVVAGGTASSTEGGIALETAVNLLNLLLDSDGNTIERTRASRQTTGGFGDLESLISDIEGGDVDVLIIDRTNPVYSAPAGVDIAEALENVPLVISTSDRVDETAIHADYLATGNHDLESWGDSNPYAGVYSVRQPTIRPLYDTRAFEESLMVWFAGSKLVPALETYLEAPQPPAGNRPGNAPTHDAGAWYRYLRNHWQTQLYPQANAVADFDAFWTDALRNGVWELDQPAEQAPNANIGAMLGALPDSVPAAGDKDPGDLSQKELHMFASIPLYDGRPANNGHLQELPDPISKHVWGSYVSVSPKTFKGAGLEMGDVLEMTIESGGRNFQRRFPVMMQPGMHDDVIAIPLGYGRSRAGKVGSDLGVNGFEFSRVVDSRQILSGFDVSLGKTRETVDVAVPQGAQVIDLHERPYMATASLAAYREDPAAGIHQHPPLPDLWEDHDYDPLKWGMSIDMTTCTGCNACVTACQEENNVPVVGRQGVIEGREMHWLRIDRYYKLPDHDEEYNEKRHSLTGDPMYGEYPYVELSEYMDNPRVIMQPMLCQHCENAPCETVCPVLATMHSSDGLNQMAYNRCVGTRYCSNNCPYKVRRFNWYNYSEDRSDGFLARLFPELEDHNRLNVEEPLPLGMNPDVTVRSRGVMEKCTFCVQRIRRAKWQVKKEGRGLRDGDVVTACQQACPADAINFGNLLDERAAVAKDHGVGRALSPLAEIGTESSIAYLTSVRNTDADHA